MLLTKLPDGRFLVLDKPDEVPSELPDGYITQEDYDKEVANKTQATKPVENKPPIVKV